jgi:uncharacterized Ntn-hydrolase superfamily protein
MPGQNLRIAEAILAALKIGGFAGSNQRDVQSRVSTRPD